MMQASVLKLLKIVISRFGLLAFIFSTFFYGCHKEEGRVYLSACKSQDPVEDIIWLREMKNSLNECDFETAIIKGNYNGVTVYYIYITDPLFEGIQIPTLYNCSGEIERNFKENSLYEFYDDVIIDTILYKCEPIL